MFESFWQDIRYAARSLRRTPGFTLAAVLTLTVGIGATAAIFSLVNAAWLKPLPYPEPERLLLLATPGSPVQTGQLFLYLRDRARTFDHIAAQRGSNGWNVVADEYATYARALTVSDEYFAVHAQRPLLGREFLPADVQSNAPNVAIISESLWRAAFGGADNAIGRPIELGGIPYVVVGVAPAGFRSFPHADVWTPLRTSMADHSRNYEIIRSLRSNATRADAEAEFAALRADIQRQFPRTNPQNLSLTNWTPLRQARVGSLREPLVLLLGAVGFLLLIACINIATLQLTRALARRREVATRAAIGGTRSRLVRHALAEAMLIGIAGSVAALILAETLPRVLIGQMSEQLATQLFSDTSVLVDWRVVAFLSAVSAAAVLVFGTGPAIVSSRPDLRFALSEGMTTPSRRATWLRRALAGAQVALACALLVGAGLLVRTLLNLYGAEPGFNSRGVLVGRMSFQGQIEPQAFESFLRTELDRVRRIPGVVAAAVSNGVPIERAVNLPLLPPTGSHVTEPRSVDWRYVTPAFFEVFEIPLLTGRLFDDRDRIGTEPVAIVNEAFARAYFWRVNVVGETISLARPLQDPPRQIIGVVANAKGRSGAGWTRGLTALGSDVSPAIFHPAGQAPSLPSPAGRRVFELTWSFRTQGRTSEAATVLREALRTVDRRATLVAFESMEDVIARDVELPRLVTSLFGGFAAIGTFLAAIGLFGLMAHTAVQRTREVGIRMALGATATRILRRFVTEGLVIAGTGLVIGVTGAALTTRALRSQLFGITPLDVTTFAAAVALLLLVAIVATVLPAFRAARVNPVAALRAE